MLMDVTLQMKVKRQRNDDTGEGADRMELYSVLNKPSTNLLRFPSTPTTDFQLNTMSAA